MSHELKKKLSQLSSKTNCKLLNDCSGDSISRRTARGLTRYQGKTSERSISANISTVHLLMIGALTGTVALVSLINLYNNGIKN